LSAISHVGSPVNIVTRLFIIYTNVKKLVQYR